MSEIDTIDAKIRELRQQIRTLKAEKREQSGKKPSVDIILGDASWTPAQREEALARLQIYENPMPKAVS